MARLLLPLLVLALVGLALAAPQFQEDFDSGWEKRWVHSTSKDKDGTAGKFKLGASDWPLSASDKGVQTTEDARFYQMSAAVPKPFSNKDKTLVLQYAVKFPQKIDCGGGYLKFGPAPAPGAAFNGDTDYNIMFGPDFCGTSTKKVHVIFNYKGKNHLIKKNISPKEDQLTHVYTLLVKPDNTYEVQIDGTKAESGKLEEDWDFLPAKEIKDPAQSKPADWVDSAEMDDPEDKKPSGWDDIPKQIRDPEAKKPEDWDDELDGAWEAPLVANPEYKGEWKAKRIPNPAYKGAWVHPMIPNPAYKADPSIYAYDSFGWVGIDVWQVKSGTIFDHILMSTDPADAVAARKAFFDANKDAEKAAFEAHEEAQKKAASAPAPAGGDDEDDEEKDAKKTEL
jgi:calreticulin